jgi:hypothetical protein
VARHGLAWYEIDVNWYGILALKRLGLAWDIKLPQFKEPRKVQAAIPAIPVIPPAVDEASVPVSPTYGD